MSLLISYDEGKEGNTLKLGQLLPLDIKFYFKKN